MAIYMWREWWTPWANTVAYYPLNWDLNDYSGNNKNLTWTSITFTSWWPWQVWVFNGSTSTAYCQDDAFDFYWTAPFTLSIWIKPNVIPSHNIVIWTEQNSNVHDKEIELLSNWVIQFQMWNGTEFTATSPNNTLSLWAWQNLIASYNGSVMKLYKNWVEMASYNWGSSYNNNPTRLVLSRIAWVWTAFDWQMSNAIVENVWWAAQEVSDYYNLTKWDYWVQLLNMNNLNLNQTPIILWEINNNSWSWDVLTM